jgi:hypothetical protein
MCFSGKCTWEQSSGDCGFPNNPEIRKKYPFPICEIFDDNEEDQRKTQEAIEDVKQMLNDINHGKEERPCN